MDVEQDNDTVMAEQGKLITVVHSADLGNGFNSDDGQLSVPEARETTVEEKGVNANLCIVCHENAGKYKCPRCGLKYCSVACNKIHKPTHDNEPEPPKPTRAPPPVEADEEITEKIGLHGKKLKHPYKTLEHSEELKWLFNKYPRLPMLLTQIFNATQPPPSAQSRIPASLRKGLKPDPNENWGKEKGVHMGKQMLRKLRREEGEDGEAIREYCTLVGALLDDAHDR